MYSGFGILNNVSNFNKFEEFEINFKDLKNIEGKWVSYEGEFKDGIINGRGNFILINGDKFSGNF